MECGGGGCAFHSNTAVPCKPRHCTHAPGACLVCVDGFGTRLQKSGLRTHNLVMNSLVTSMVFWAKVCFWATFRHTSLYGAYITRGRKT